MRIRKTQSQSEFESVIDDYITRGYEVLTRGQDTCKLREHGGWGSAGGHLAVFLLTIWWTLGIGNIVYALYKRYSGEEVLVQLNED